VLGLAFLLQAIIYHKEGKDFKAVLFASIGTAIKIFPVFVIPLLIARSKRKLFSSLAIIPIILLSLLVYSASGSILLDLNTLVMGRSVPTYLGVYISQGLTWQIVLSDLLIRSFPSIFIYVFVPSYIAYTIYAFKRNIGLERYFITSMLIFFVTYNFMNPQYLIWIIPFFIFLGEYRYAVFVSLLGSIYLYLNYSYTYFLNPDIAWNYNASFLGQIEAIRHALTSNFAVLGAFGVLSTIIFIYLLIRMLKQSQKNGLEPATG
jgi:drug/metabolite transporter superfamily protein YnfA